MHASPAGLEVSTIGKYQLIANLGHGGMADVYLAVVHGPVGWSKLTVIKRLRPSLADEPEFLAMFLDEARLAARLNHPNVVQTNEVAEVDGVYFIAMEYLDGQPLNRILHRANKMEPPPRELLLRVVADALAGLHHAHELRDYDGSPLHVVHRDASPHNIFVTYEGQTKVVDFGIAKAATRSSETKGGVLKGKIAYMAPEQPRSEGVDRRADIYAMGLVMWEVLAGQRMRKGSDIEMLDRIAQGDARPLSSVWPGCPPALAAIVARATAFSKEGRYATASEMRQDILAYLDSIGARSSAEDVGKLVAELFEGKRAEMKSIIERQLSGLRRASTEEVGLRVVDARRLAADSMELPRVSIPSVAPGPSSGAATPVPPTMVSGATTATGSAVSTGTPLSNTRSSRIRAPLWIGAVAFGAAVTIIALRKGDEGGSGVGAATSAATATATGAATATATSAVTADDGAHETIEVRISARPEQAKMWLDDTALGTNPFVGRFRRDDRAHSVRVEAEGHASVVRSISFATDQTVEIALEHASAPKGKLPQAKDEAPEAKDDDELPRPGTPPKKELDEDDPWK